MITRKVRISMGIWHEKACSIKKLNNFNKREHYIENLITTERTTVALDNLFDNSCITEGPYCTFSSGRKLEYLGETHGRS